MLWRLNDQEREEYYKYLKKRKLERELSQRKRHYRAPIFPALKYKKIEAAQRLDSLKNGKHR